MNIKIKATGILLTPALHDYAAEKVASLGRFLPSYPEGEVMADVEIGKTTHHHKTGEFFRAEINLDFPGQALRTVSVEEDLYAAIDVAKDERAEKVKDTNKRKTTLVKRGGRLLKKLLRFKGE